MKKKYLIYFAAILFLTACQSKKNEKSNNDSMKTISENTIKKTSDRKRDFIIS